ncbi:MAG: hypothetical protein HY721_09970 [Planctomycetes bacterium]|nr:hypothetical protein [Planctomycetota bacterium]
MKKPLTASTVLPLRLPIALTVSMSAALAIALWIYAALPAPAAEGPDALTGMAADDLAALTGRPADIGPSAYLYRRDRPADRNPPESWIGLIQYAGLPYERPVDASAPGIQKVICALLWEEVRPVRRVELSWPAVSPPAVSPPAVSPPAVSPPAVSPPAESSPAPGRRGQSSTAESLPTQGGIRPSPDDLTVSFFDGTDGTAHTWWNPRTLQEAGKPEVSADGRTYAYAIPADTWGVVVAARGEKDAAAFAVPAIRALVPDVWKEMEIEVEWGFDDATETLAYDGRIEAYDGRIGEVHPLAGDSGPNAPRPDASRTAASTTIVTGPASWRSPGNVEKGTNGAKRAQGGAPARVGEQGKAGEPAKGGERRGVRADVLYMGTSRWRREWPYHAQADEVARTILTVWTVSGSFSFRVSDLELGPILAPEHGFFVRSSRIAPAAPSRLPAAKAPAAALPGGPLPAEQLPGLPLPSVPWFTLEASTLGEKMPEMPGVPKMRGWARNVIPWFGVNPERESGKAGSLTVPARSAAMHPGPDVDVAVGWRSPIVGRVNVRGKVSMGDSSGGNGVEWSIVHESRAGRRLIASGAVPTGGSQAFSEGLEGKGHPKDVAEIPVEEGDVLSLVVGAKAGEHTCDTTIIDLKFVEVVEGVKVGDAGSDADSSKDGDAGRTLEGRTSAGRTWHLVRDVADSVHEGNPHADSLGNAEVWRFYALAAAPTPPAPSEPPFPLASTARTGRELVRELAGRGLKTIRQRTREHAEQTWDGAVRAMRPGEALPPHPSPPFEPSLRVEVPCERLTAQWKLGAWHILRRSLQGDGGKWRFNDFPFGILASETYMIIRALDLQGLHKEAADGLDQWLRIPMEPKVVGGQGGHHEWALPDRPLGHFSDGKGCLTHAEGIPGAGGHMDGVHCMGPGTIMFALTEHFLLTGDLDWLKAHAPRMKANAEWILRQRRLLAGNISGGERLWAKGLQPAHVVTPDSLRMHMQFYESEAYYWLAVRRLADLLALIDPKEGAAMAAEAEAYRKDLLAAIDRSIALTPVVAVRDGTYRSFVPFAPYVRGFATGAWGWRRCQGHVGAIYWDTVQSADPLISPAGLLSPRDRRVQGHLDVLEDRLLLENTKIRERSGAFDREEGALDREKGRFDPERGWFSRASWQYQCGLERHANIHLAADDPPNFIRSTLNQYSVDIVPGEYTFREHTTGGPPDKIYEESCFLERLRGMLVFDADGSLWLARATPRAWLEKGKRISVKDAPTHLGPVSYEIVSDASATGASVSDDVVSGAGEGSIAATVQMPPRPGAVFLRLRHPKAAPIRSVTIDGQPSIDFDRDEETVRLSPEVGTARTAGTVRVEVRY